MNTVKNKRYLETENRIRQAFVQLLAVKNYCDISVHDICTSAQLSRPSFYAHYDDINDLIIQIEQEKGSQIQKLLISGEPLSVYSFEQYFTFLKENRTFYVAYLTASSSKNVANRLMDTFLLARNISLSDQVRYQMHFFMAGLRTIALHWLQENCRVAIPIVAKIAYDQHTSLGV